MINLGIYSFPGGTSFCDRNRTENNDYKELAFVRVYGQIQYKTPREKLPHEIIEKIESEARTARAKFEADTRHNWKLDRVKTYFRMLDYLPISEVLKITAEKDDAEKLKMIIAAYEHPEIYEEIPQ